MIKHNKLYLLTSLFGVFSLVSCGCSSIWRPELEEFIFKTHFSDAASWCNKAYLTSKIETKDTKGKILSSRYTNFYFESKKGENLYYHLVEKVNEENSSYKYINLKLFKDQETSKYMLQETKDDKKQLIETTEDYLIERIEPFFFQGDDNGFKTGGMYRGDELKTMGNLQVYMYVDEALNELVYNYIKQPIGHIISTMLYRVNSHGLLLHEEILNEEENVKTSTINIDIKYNDDAKYDEETFDIK